MEHLIYSWNDYELGAPLDTPYDALRRTDDLSESLIEDLYTFTLESSPASAEDLNKLGKDKPDEEMSSILFDYYNANSGTPINSYDDDDDGDEGDITPENQAVCALMSQWITNGVYKSLDKELQSKFVDMCGELDLEIAG